MPSAAEFENPTKECDLVMKGGITSGVVYPFTIQELAREHRLVNIGGTSAGAIAAAMAAAAEYRRRSGGSGEGFAALSGLVDYLGEHLLDLLQPHPQHRKAFETILKLLHNKKNPLASLPSILGFIPKARRLYKAYKRLPETYFALCPGPTQEGRNTLGLTDWLNESIETLAGSMAAEGDPPATPLTFGDLRSAGIRLRTLTTDLGSRNPAMLPFHDDTWLFREEELRDLLPAAVLQQLVAEGQEDGDAPGFRKLPPPDKIPVLLAARASLSFPILLAALPLYRRDYSHRLSREEMKKPRRCWLSDGGISSNFPIHLFDSPLPKRPTFGLSLDEYSPTRHDSDPAKTEARVYLPSAAGKGIRRPIGKDFTNPLGFLAAIFDTARNWQDSLQTVLPGYRERIVHIALDSDEGGLNLEMEPETIRRLADYGKLAGKRLAKFELDEHKWRRLLATTAALEDAFEAMADNLPQLKESVEEHVGSFRPSGDAQRADLWRRWDALGAVMQAWSEAPLREAWGSGGMPRPRTYVKFAPREQAGRD